VQTTLIRVPNVNAVSNRTVQHTRKHSSVLQRAFNKLRLCPETDHAYCFRMGQKEYPNTFLGQFSQKLLGIFSLSRAYRMTMVHVNTLLQL